MNESQTVVAAVPIAASSIIAAVVRTSWNDGAARAVTVGFVERATEACSADFIPAEGGIAVSDNEDCPWSKKPVRVQLLFAIDRVGALALQHPEWQSTAAFHRGRSPQGAAKGTTDSSRQP